MVTKDKEKFQIYMETETAELVRQYCKRNNKTYSDFLGEVVKQYFAKSYKDSFAKTMLPTEDKLNQILNMVQNIQTTTNAAYRAADYAAYIAQQKIDQGLKDSARKKVMVDYNALLNGNLTLEQYLKEVSNAYVYETKQEEIKEEPATKEQKPESLFVLNDEGREIQRYEIDLYNRGMDIENLDKLTIPAGYVLDKEQHKIIKR